MERILAEKEGGKGGGLLEEMKRRSMKYHVGELMEGKWEPTIHGYLQFLVDSRIVFATLEKIVSEEAYPAYAELKNTGLERRVKLEEDLSWFRDQGYTVPKPSPSGVAYSTYLEGISNKDYQAFICHFYNIYFAHSAGGRMIGKKVAHKLLENRELNFYKWDGELRQLLQGVREKLNQVMQDHISTVLLMLGLSRVATRERRKRLNWSEEERSHCLEETKISFDYSFQILNAIHAQ